MILTGFYRWLGALGLAGFTLMATFVANRFWEAGEWRRPSASCAVNSFFEHWGLVGGFLLEQGAPPAAPKTCQGKSCLCPQNA